MKNKNRAAAAQTASIGNQDMMTFMPSPETGSPVVEGRGSQEGIICEQNNNMSNNNNNNNTGEGGIIDDDLMMMNNIVVPDPLRSRTALDRGESFADDDAFNASLDTLLKEAAAFDDVPSSYGDGQSLPSLGGLMDPAPSIAMGIGLGSSTTTTASVASPSSTSAGVGGRKRKAPPRAQTLQSEMSSLTNSSDSTSNNNNNNVNSPPQSQQVVQGVQQISQQRQAKKLPQPPNLNFSARGIVELPPMFASQPITVSTSSTAAPNPAGPQQTGHVGAPGSINLQSMNQFLGRALGNNNNNITQQVVNRTSSTGTGTGGGGAQQQQQQQAALPFQVASIPLPQHLQQGTNNTNLGTAALSSGTAGLMTQMRGAVAQAPSQGQPHQQRIIPQGGGSQATQVKVTNELFPAFQLGSNPWDALMASATVQQQPNTRGTLSQQQAGVPTALPPAVPSSARVAGNLPSSVPMVGGSSTNPPMKKKGITLSSTVNKLSSSSYSVPNSRKRRASNPNMSSLAISEDEEERKKRRHERNAREQERSHKITERIAELKSVLSEAGIHFKPDRYSTLVSVVNYIKALQVRSASLDDEHRKLLATIAGADKMVKSGGPEVVTTTQTHTPMENASNSSTTSSSNDEEFLVFVQGIDYKTIFASCGVALAIASVDGRFVDCNEEFLRITSYTRKELLGDERRTSVLPYPQDDSPPSPIIGGGTLGQQGQVVTVSTTTSSNATHSALEAAAAKKKIPDLHASTRTLSPPPSNRPPSEIHMRKQHHLSLFNLLGGEDMEAVYSAMSRMLRAPEVPTASAASTSSRVVSNSSRSKEPTDDSGGTSSSSSDEFVKSDLTSTAESSSGNEVSNEESKGESGVTDGSISRYTVDHWSGRVKHTRRKNHMVSCFRLCTSIFSDKVLILTTITLFFSYTLYPFISYN